MTRGNEPRDNGRRTFLGSFATASIVMLAGCGRLDADDTSTVSPSEDSRGKGSPREEEVLHREVERLETIYDSLSELPITDRGRFAFDVDRFEEGFDHESLISRTEDVQDEISSVSESSLQDSKVDALISIAETATLLVQQRVILHQVIAAGLTFESRFYETDFARANEAITDGRVFLGDLDSNGESIEETMIDHTEVSQLVDGYDPDAITRTQTVLVDTVSWTDSAYEGLHHMSEGMKLFVEGNSALQDEQYETAEVSYRESRDHYDLAQQAFDEALENESTLPYISPLVDNIRCVLPAYLTSSSRLGESMHLLQNEEQARGRKMAREATNSADRIASRCF